MHDFDPGMLRTHMKSIDVSWNIANHSVWVYQTFNTGSFRRASNSQNHWLLFQKISFGNRDITAIESRCDNCPGIRRDLFLQGCSSHCQHFQNYDIQVHSGGLRWKFPDWSEGLLRLEKITIFAKEPTEQFKSLMILLQILKHLHFKVCLYNSSKISQVSAVLFNLVDYL